MTPAIDILEIAASRYHYAQEALLGTMHMQSSPSAAAAGEWAVATLNERLADLNAAHRLSAELSEAFNRLDAHQ